MFFLLIEFSVQEFETALKWAVPASIAIGVTSFVITACSSLYDLVRSKSSLLMYLLNVIQFIVYFAIAFFLFGISLVGIFNKVLNLLQILLYF